VFLDLSLAATTTPSGDPTLRPDLDPASVTPGTLGFLATLFMVVVVIFLIRDMVKRIRRVRYAAEVAQSRAQRGDSRTRGVPPAAGGTGDGSGGSDGTSGFDGTGGGTGDGPGGSGRPAPGGKRGPDNR
jgi:uncharacterized membrane protein YgcG